MKVIFLGVLLVVTIGLLYIIYQPTPTSKPEFEMSIADRLPTDEVSKEQAGEPLTVAPTLRTLSSSVIDPEPYRELVSPSAYLHTDGLPITLKEHIGNKIILLSFMTYSCINCQRTFPTLVRLDETYRDDGLLIIGIHTPEFTFEHDARRVEAELSQYGITFPVVLDNEYKTWNSYENRFWPRRYIIDGTGNVVYDHIGEGDYDGTERVIKALLPTLPTV